MKIGRISKHQPEQVGIARLGKSLQPQLPAIDSEYELSENAECFVNADNVCDADFSRALVGIEPSGDAPPGVGFVFLRQPERTEMSVRRIADPDVKVVLNDVDPEAVRPKAKFTWDRIVVRL
jgi:hypothetical protein